MAIYLFLILLLSLLVCLSIAGRTDAKDVKEHHVYTGTSIFIDGGEIVSNDTMLYVGKTNIYVFYYNSKSNFPIIYPMGKIDKIIFMANPVQKGGVRPNVPH